MDNWYRVENEDDVPSPALLVYPDRIAENLAAMVRWAGAERLRPHVKTHKMPRVIEMKLQAGITRFKTSTIAEAEMTASAGGRDIMLAYQPVGPNICRLVTLADTFPEVHFSTLVDAPSIADALSSAVQAAGQTLDVYLDLNVGLNRTGIAPEDAAELYHRVVSLPGLRAAGLHVYDGHIRETDEQRAREQVEAAFEPVWQLKSELESAGADVPAIVGCGTVTSKVMAQGHAMEVSAGTSVLWDAGAPGYAPPMEIKHAAVLLARVISRPTRESICVDLGHKAVASEMAPPRVRFFGYEDCEAIIHSEEHLVLRGRQAAEAAVGTVLYGIPTHICPTVALHEHAHCVRQGRAGELWPIPARARCLTI
jgi:D-serine deaminase-like pyridoxal phosphate-dependent protein